MRYLLVMILSQFSFSAIGQRIDFRNDSLFINKYFIRNTTPKETLDSLLQSKGKVKKWLSNHVYPGTNQRMRGENYIYASKGLIITRNKDFDTAQLSIRIKLQRYTDHYVDQTNMPTRVFKGELFIADNYMNDKKNAGLLQELRNCTVQFRVHTFSLGRNILGGDIKYKQRPISFDFDILTDEITNVRIN